MSPRGREPLGVRVSFATENGCVGSRVRVSGGRGDLVLTLGLTLGGAPADQESGGGVSDFGPLRRWALTPPSENGRVFLRAFLSASQAQNYFSWVTGRLHLVFWIHGKLCEGNKSSVPKIV